MHVLAQKHNLSHRSSGKGDRRFITVWKRTTGGGARAARVDEAEVEAQFHRAHASGYSHQNRGMGLGFAGGYHAAPPPKSLLRQCRAEPTPSRPAAAPQPTPGQSAATSRPPPNPPARLPTERRSQGSAAVPPPPPLVAQWVSVLLGASSQYSPSDHSAKQLMGPPKVYPRATSDVRAWSAVPRPGAQRMEWVRVGFKQAVHPVAVTVIETYNPGSVVALRGTAHPKGAQAEASEWFAMWSGATSWSNESGQARRFRPPLREDCLQRLVSAVEITLDTTGWYDEWWSEMDAVQLEGMPPAAPTAATDAPSVVVAWLTRMPWETDQAYAGRVRFDRERYGPAPPADDTGAMRRAAMSMAHANMTTLGCTYPTAVERCITGEIGGAGQPHPRRRQPGATSGMAVEGQLRAEAAALAI